MNVCALYYDGFCEFELVLTAAQFKESLLTVALEDRVYVSEEKQRFLPHKRLAEVNPTDIDLFIITGGDPSYLYDNVELQEFVEIIRKNGAYIAGICGGTYLMAKYGLLDGKKCTGGSSGILENEETKSLFKKANIINEDVVIDGKIVTATGQAFVELAGELAQLMGIYKSETERVEDYKWMKNIKS